MEFLKYFDESPKTSPSTRQSNPFYLGWFKENKSTKRLSIEQRDALAKKRWAKIAKLRMIMLSISE